MAAMSDFLSFAGETGCRRRGSGHGCARRWPAASRPGRRCGACRPCGRPMATTWPSSSSHPVIVGKRALPAVHLDGAGLGGALRLLARPGDVLLAVSTAGRARRRRLPAAGRSLGLTRIWLGAGPRAASAGPPSTSSWLDQDPSGGGSLGRRRAPLPPAVGAHPRRLRAPRPPRRRPATCTDEVCITCSDEGQVAEIRPSIGDVGRGPAGGDRRRRRSLVEPVSRVLVLVHAGVAIDRDR